MANAIWNEKESRWKLRVMRDGVSKVFTSSKPGRPGKLEVNRKLRAWEDGESDRIIWKVEKCWKMFLDDVAMRSGPENLRNVESCGRLYILPKCGTKKLGSMRITDWQDIINSASGERVKILTKKSLSNIRGTIISFCRYAERAGMLDAAPSVLYIPKAAPTIGKGILQPDELKALFAPSEEWYIYAWRLMAVTGLRPGEVYGIQRRDIVNGVLTISRSVNNANRITGGKNENAHRDILLHEIALAIVEAQVTQTEKLDSEWLFCNHMGGMPHQGIVYKQWRRFSAANGINVSPYSLRHTFVSLVKNDMPAEMVKAIVGHSKSMDTFGVYGKQVSGEMQQSAKILDITLKKYLEK